MIGFLKKRAPRNFLLATLYWVVWLALALAVLFVIFYFLDDKLPGAGQF